MPDEIGSATAETEREFVVERMVVVIPFFHLDRAEFDRYLDIQL